jgi:ankyrin repeat protein
MQMKYVIINLLTIIFLTNLLLAETSDSYDHTVYEVQKKLKDLGYDLGRPDGIYGRKTKSAVRQFQRDNGLPVTGKLDELTKANLGLEKPSSPLSLTEAVRTNDIVKVKTLLAAGVDVNGRDKVGDTPLHVAAVRGYKETATLLIAKGADVNAEDEHGLTPLHAAAWMGHKEIVALLIAKGTDISAKNKEGIAALHTAALAGRRDTAALLIANDADVNTKNEGGMTPLHAAAWMGHKETVALLIAKGADVNARNEDGLTPLDAAHQKGYGAIVELLRKHTTQE